MNSSLSEAPGQQDLRELNPILAPSEPRRKLDDLRCHFFKSLEMMRDLYGLRLGDFPDEWLDAGWERPMFRLRTPYSMSG
jgi:hypothetical protein